MTATSNRHTKVMTGNGTAAMAALLCRPEVVAAYPITPQSEVVEQLAAFHADGVLDCEMVTPEGENSAQNVVCAASMAGARVFTATSSYGLVYMYDAMFNSAGYRAPHCHGQRQPRTAGYSFRGLRPAGHDLHPGRRLDARDRRRLPGDYGHHHHGLPSS